MAIQWKNGLPHLDGKSLLSDVPEYTDALVEVGANPVGTVLPYALPDPPDGWNLCDGSSIDESTALGQKLKNAAFPYGQDSGKPRLPDLQGRVIVAAGNSDVLYTVGGTGGESTVTLTADESGMPGHNHGGETADCGNLDHTHAPYPGNTAYLQTNGGALAASGSEIGAATSTPYNTGGVVEGAAGLKLVHKHGITAEAARNATSDHENMPPYVVLNYIIRVS